MKISIGVISLLIILGQTCNKKPNIPNNIGNEIQRIELDKLTIGQLEMNYTLSSNPDLPIQLETQVGTTEEIILVPDMIRQIEQAGTPDAFRIKEYQVKNVRIETPRNPAKYFKKDVGEVLKFDTLKLRDVVLRDTTTNRTITVREVIIRNVDITSYLLNKAAESKKTAEEKRDEILEYNRVRKDSLERIVRRLEADIKQLRQKFDKILSDPVNEIQAIRNLKGELLTHEVQIRALRNYVDNIKGDVPIEDVETKIDKAKLIESQLNDIDDLFDDFSSRSPEFVPIRTLFNSGKYQMTDVDRRALQAVNSYVSNTIVPYLRNRIDNMSSSYSYLKVWITVVAYADEVRVGNDLARALGVNISETQGEKNRVLSEKRAENLHRYIRQQIRNRIGSSYYSKLRFGRTASGRYDFQGKGWLLPEHPYNVTCPNMTNCPDRRVSICSKIDITKP